MRSVLLVVGLLAGCQSDVVPVGMDAELVSRSTVECEWECWTDGDAGKQCEWCCDGICAGPSSLVDGPTEPPVDELGGGGTVCCETECDGNGNCETCCEYDDGRFVCHESS